VGRLRIGWFSSGRGAGSQALLRDILGEIERGLPVEIAYLFCNRERGEHPPADQLMDLAAAHGIAVLTLSSSRFRRRAGGAIVRAGQPLPPWRLDYDRAVYELVRPYAENPAILAGYMLIAPELCRRMNLLNLHPAAPGGPIGTWQSVIWQLIEQRATESGVTIQRATPELDAGPSLAYCRYPLRGGGIDQLWQAVEDRRIEDLREAEGEALPLFQAIRQRGARRETPLILATLAALGSGAIRLLVDAGGAPAAGLDLSEQVEARLAGALE
jgi:phosphoribosylglycinamide formyltransferase-1